MAKRAAQRGADAGADVGDAVRRRPRELRVRDAEQGVSDARYTVAQRTYELAEAEKTAAKEIDANADAVARLRDEWTELLRLHPQVEAFLGAALAKIPAGATAAPPALVPGGVTFGTGVSRATPLSADHRQITITNNITQTDPDPVNVAKAMMWYLN